MIARHVFSLVWLLALALSLCTLAAEDPVPQKKSTSKAVDPNDKEQVEIKKELQLLDKVFRRRLLLHYLKEEKEKREAVLKVLAPTRRPPSRDFWKRNRHSTSSIIIFWRRWRTAKSGC